MTGLSPGVEKWEKSVLEAFSVCVSVLERGLGAVLGVDWDYTLLAELQRVIFF